MSAYIREIPSFERERIHGQSNLRTVRDGGWVLRAIERERVRRAPCPTVVRSTAHHSDEELTGREVSAELA